MICIIQPSYGEYISSRATRHVTLFNKTFLSPRARARELIEVQRLIDFLEKLKKFS